MCCFQASTEGHTYLPEEELTRRTGQLLEVGEEQIEKQYMDLAIERKIIMKQGENQTQIYAASFYYMEANTATMLKQLNVSYDVPDLEIEERVRRIEKQTGMELDEHQMTAVKGGAQRTSDYHRRTGYRKNDDDQYDHQVF